MATRRFLLVYSFMFHDSVITPVVAVRRRPKSRVSVRRHYKLDDVASFILGARSTPTCDAAPFRRVALQFPDDLLHDAVAVTAALKSILDADTRGGGDACVAGCAERPAAAEEEKETSDKTIRLFVIADNTFGSCCPDEITAQHYGSDCIVHFGSACMSRSTRIPVFYVQDDFRFSVPASLSTEAEEELSVQVVLRAAALLQNCLKELLQSLEKKSISAGVMLVVVGDHRSRRFVETAAQRWRDVHDVALAAGSGVAVEWCGFDLVGNAAASHASVASPSSSENVSWVVNGVRFPRADPTTLQRFLFIGPSSSMLPLHLLNVHQHNLFHHPEALREEAFDSDHPAVLTTLDESFSLSTEMEVAAGTRSCDGDAGDSKTGDHSEEVGMMDAALEGHFNNNAENITHFQTALGKRMRQRAFNMELIRSSSAIGILVASLAIEGYYETTMLIHQLLRGYGKRAYIIYIGHLNEYKIANFVDTVDCFVVIACPNSRESHFPEKSDGFSKPIVSPVEVVLALRTEDSDSPLFGHPAVYSTAFDCVLPLLRDAVQAVRSEQAEKKTSFVAMPQENSGGAALIRTCAGVVATQSANGALARLHQRTFVGLDPQKGQTPVQEEIIEGRHGIARGYASERKQQQEEEEEQRQ